MRRMAIGTVTGVAIWFGSMMAAEAQQIQPTGPLSVASGATSSTYSADINLPNPCAYVVRLWIYRNSLEIHYSQTIVANPGVQNSSFTKVAGHTAVYTGDVLTYKASMKVGTTWYQAPDWTVIVSGTRPTKTLQKASTLALHSADRDRRRE